MSKVWGSSKGSATLSLGLIVGGGGGGGAT